ncbi:hypothetical protein OAS20_00295 [Gammaproteobacteria bacterium]|nr:hypothetical protein [Gammaproteobacteria bacterium]
MPETTIQDGEFPTIIQEYERGIAKGENTFNLTLDTLKKINVYGKTKGSLLRRGVPEHQLEHWYTRLAAALTRFAATPLSINEKMLYALALRKPEIVYAFAASGYRGTAHLIHLCAQDSEGTSFQYDRSTLLLMLSMLSINDLPFEMLKAAVKLPPEHYFILSMGWLSERAVISQQGENNRTYLIDTSDKYSDIDIEADAISPLAKVWMYCTYADSPNKHKIKVPLNNLLRKFMAKQNVKIKPVTYIKKAKPTVLVINEYFQKTHAMYRCYAPLLRSLKEDFNLIGLADEKVIDKKEKDIFSYIKAENYDGMPFVKLVEIVNKIKPDIIYYPSVGMRWWVIMLANLRLAPIQLASLGHPATTQSQFIDYYYVTDQRGDLSQIYSEKVLRAPQIFGAEAHPGQLEVIEKLSGEKTRTKEGVINIAINAKVMKLSYRLLSICERLIDSTEHEIIFHFFPGEVGIYDDGVRALIKRSLPESIIYPTSNYLQFMQNLNRCDICLAAFPFGNTNSTVDACLLKIPVVAHFGIENAAQTDSKVMRSVNYPEWLLTKNDEEYYATAKRLVDEVAAGIDLRSHLVDVIPMESISDIEKDTSTYLRDFVLYLHKNHEELVTSDSEIIEWHEIERSIE